MRMTILFARHSGESRNPASCSSAPEATKELDPGFRRDDERLKVIA